MDRAKISSTCAETLKLIPVATDPTQPLFGREIYAFLFKQVPDLRSYFKGAENFSIEQVLSSDRFAKQGGRLLLSLHTTVQLLPIDFLFKAHIQDLMVRHQRFKMDPGLWVAFWGLFVEYLKTKATLTDEQITAWKLLGEAFNEEAQAFIKTLN